MSDAALPRLLFPLPAVTLTWLVAASAFAEPRVLTSIKPLQLIAAAVRDGVGTPDVLLPAGASPHLLRSPSFGHGQMKQTWFTGSGGTWRAFCLPYLRAERTGIGCLGYAGCTKGISSEIDDGRHVRMHLGT